MHKAADSPRGVSKATTKPTTTSLTQILNPEGLWCLLQVREYKGAAEQAALLAQAAQRRLLVAEQQLAAHTQEDSLWHTQQLAEQAKCTVKLGIELQQLKQQMMQLHLSVVQPLLRYQHEQQHPEATASTSSSRGSSSRKHSHKQWQAPAAVTPGVIDSAAAAVEQLLLQQQVQQEQARELRSSQAVLVEQSCQCQQQLQDKVSGLEAELQVAVTALEGARRDASTARLRAERLEQQLAASNTQHNTAEQLHEGAKQLQQQELQELQQQVNMLVAELACAQGEAAAARRQVALLQDERQRAAAEFEAQLQQLQMGSDGRWAPKGLGSIRKECCSLEAHGPHHMYRIAVSRLTAAVHVA